MREGEQLTDLHQVTHVLDNLDLPHSPDNSYLDASQPLSYEQQAPIDPKEYTEPNDISALVSSDNVCRICLEPEASENLLIHPCKCTGTVRYIHEECLKAWLVSQADDMDKAECELCKTPFSMTIKLSRKCNPGDVCKDGFTQCLFAPLLLAVLGMLVLIVYLLSDKYLASADSGEQRGYTAALIATCVVSALVITYLLFRSLREACCSKKLSEWKILNYEVSEPEQDREVSEREKTSANIDHATSPTHLDIKPMDDPQEEEKESAPPVMVLPKRIKVHGVKVKTPDLHSASLTPVNQRGRTVAVTPRIFAFPASLSQSRASLNVTPKSQFRGRLGQTGLRDVGSPTVVPSLYQRWTPDVTLEHTSQHIVTAAPVLSESCFPVPVARI